MKPASGGALIDAEGEVAAAEAGVAEALRVARLAAEPLFHEKLLLLASRSYVCGEDCAQFGVGFHTCVEVVDDGLDDRAATDALDEWGCLDRRGRLLRLLWGGGHGSSIAERGGSSLGAVASRGSKPEQVRTGSRG